MSAETNQLAIEYNGKQYSGVYSVSGNLMIARIPGISSRSLETAEADESQARTLLMEILKEADTLGQL